MKSYKHLSEDERYKIQNGLDNRKSFKKIARELGRDCSTISKEVRLRRVFRQTGSLSGPFNDCVYKYDCTENSLCPDEICRNKMCKRCTKAECRKLCCSYENVICEKRETPPYCCNGCNSKNRCSLEKALYIARGAQKEYETVMKESRSGICADEDEILRLDKYISPLLKKGQSVHHILVNAPGKIMWSEKTIYKFVDLGLFSARNIDLRRKVRFRPRKSKHESLKVDRACHIGRTYDDYQKYITDNPSIHTVQMDTVHGKVGGKCLLTLHFVNAHFMLAFLLDACTTEAVKSIFVYLRNIFGTDLYKKLLPLLLADRGSEFSNPRSIEFNEEGEAVSRIFYCDPQRSDQKGSLENNHEMIRAVIPKGTSMDLYTQNHISLMMDHVNSYGRPAINDKSPYHMLNSYMEIKH